MEIYLKMCPSRFRRDKGVLWEADLGNIASVEG